MRLKPSRKLLNFVGFVPTDDQWAAVTRALHSRLSVLTGGPGVGKTASMRALVDLLRANRKSVRLAPVVDMLANLEKSTAGGLDQQHRPEW